MNSKNQDQAIGFRPIGDVLSDLDNEIKGTITKYLRIKTRSFSSFEEKVTGNSYQSLRMRDEILPGFRSSDEDIYAGMGMSGKTFIDMGCNFGERTRIAARNGAAFAEGVEYEEFFVRIGALVSAYNSIHNCLIRQGDITKPGCLTRDYDIGACFSAFVYVRQNLREITSKIKHFFILETHALDRNWFNKNISQVVRFMPYWMIYDMTDHGGRMTEGRRACVLFARKTDPLLNTALVRARELGMRNKNIADIDIQNSGRIQTLCGEPARGSEKAYAELRTEFMKYETLNQDQVVQILKNFIATMDSNTAPISKKGFGSDAYWVSLFRGLIDMVDTGGISDTNSYLLYMRALSIDGDYDVGLRSLFLDPIKGPERVTLRLAAVNEALKTKTIGSAPAVAINAVSVDAAEAAHLSLDHSPKYHSLTDARGKKHVCNWFDGYHRLAALYLSGAKSAPCMFVWTNLRPLGVREQAPGASSDPSADLPWSDTRVQAVLEVSFDNILRGK